LTRVSIARSALDDAVVTKRMGCRVKPGNDVGAFIATVIPAREPRQRRVSPEATSRSVDAVQGSQRTARTRDCGVWIPGLRPSGRIPE
jgi:hypothetical protein